MGRNKTTHCRQIVIGNVYRPPQGNINSFIDTLELNLSNLNLDRMELILMGNFNIYFADKRNSNCKKILDLIKPLGLRQLIRNATRPSLHRDSCIDLIITNADSIEMAGVIDISLSDHLLVHCNRKLAKFTKTKCNFMGRSYRNYNKNDFQQNIREANWEEFDNCRTVTNKWEIFENIIRENINKMCPIKNFKIKQKKEPWITNELIE